MASADLLFDFLAVDRGELPFLPDSRLPGTGVNRDAAADVAKEERLEKAKAFHSFAQRVAELLRHRVGFAQIPRQPDGVLAGALRNRQDNALGNGPLTSTMPTAVCQQDTCNADENKLTLTVILAINRARLGEMPCASCRALGTCPRRFFFDLRPHVFRLP